VLTPAGEEAGEVLISLDGGQQVHARLVFRDPDPVAGAPSALWVAQAGPARGFGTSALGAAAAALNALTARLRPV
jgi:hypothetical protein